MLCWLEVLWVYLKEWYIWVICEFICSFWRNLHANFHNLCKFIFPNDFISLSLFSLFCGWMIWLFLVQWILHSFIYILDINTLILCLICNFFPSKTFFTEMVREIHETQEAKELQKSQNAETNKIHNTHPQSYGSSQQWLRRKESLTSLPSWKILTYGAISMLFRTR